MSDEENVIETNVQATDNSTAVGKIEVGGSVGGSINIGGTNIINNYATPESVRSPDLDENIEMQYFEPETILIPAGTFLLGSDPGDGIKDYETPRHEVFIPDYRISKYPILNWQYAEFITKSEAQVSAPLVGFSGLKPKGGLEHQPVQGVTLEDARAYCKWLSEMTKRKYDLPNEAQLEKIYQGRYDISDIFDDIYLWTCTLWGENISPPEFRYPYPSKRDDGRNSPNANNQIRRVVCRYKKAADADRPQRASRSGQFPKRPLSPERYSFRVVMNF
jgi:formylglycine-generating enzyme required for sulfatase activity